MKRLLTYLQNYEMPATNVFVFSQLKTSEDIVLPSFPLRGYHAVWCRAPLQDDSWRFHSIPKSFFSPGDSVLKDIISWYTLPPVKWDSKRCVQIIFFFDEEQHLWADNNNYKKRTLQWNNKNWFREFHLFDILYLGLPRRQCLGLGHLKEG